jgi:NAD-dependent dihydropyrimidine dehydrogenase PreA subunit
MTCEADGQYCPVQSGAGDEWVSDGWRCVCSCEFQNLVYKFKVEELLPQYHRDRSHTRDASSHSVVRDMNKCVLCTRCIRACSQVQGMVRDTSVASRQLLPHPLTTPTVCSTSWA